MPELPEVEAARRAIEENCLGKKIKRAIIANDSKVIEGVSSLDFESALLGKTIVSAHRKGKNLWLHLDSPPFPSFQFGMAGAIYIKGVAVTKYKRSAVKDNDEWPSKYSKFFVETCIRFFLYSYFELPIGFSRPDELGRVDMKENTNSEAGLWSFGAVGFPVKMVINGSLLDDGLELSFTDKRRFARFFMFGLYLEMIWLVQPTSVPPISELGPDALFEPMTINEFTDSLSKKKIGIKALLLDQLLVPFPPSVIPSGILSPLLDFGDSQSLFLEISILVISQELAIGLQMKCYTNLSKENCATLHNCIKEVIQYAVEVDADCNRFPCDWLFHFRWGKKSGKIKGKIPLMKLIIVLKKLFLQVIEKAVEVGADSSQFPSNWIFHSREKKPGKAFVDGLAPEPICKIMSFLLITGKKIDFINAGGRTSAYVPELQKLSGTVATKAAGKPRKQASKEKGGDEAEDNDDDEDGVGDEPTNEEEESTKITKPHKGGNPRGRGKKPPMKRKAKESDDDDEDDSGGNNDGSSEEHDEDPTEKGRKVKTNTSNKQAKTVKTSKRAVSSQDGKKPKRAK
ncbi:formamidopyrimidine-DNA glycosylase isoform X1 [Gossypium australe]|uniref:Formamidopyrimidine-DNA glycosylase isoform X1 n=1 Tax=Gossypium australe TaxID=47621 RepID=A0A5B6WDZ0_9ROSI|nr:formamidopyrimidine-DNA glycosylase isoform X1 [Gossypium australe]